MMAASRRSTPRRAACSTTVAVGPYCGTFRSRPAVRAGRQDASSVSQVDLGAGDLSPGGSRVSPVSRRAAPAFRPRSAFRRRRLPSPCQSSLVLAALLALRRASTSPDSVERAVHRRPRRRADARGGDSRLHAESAAIICGIARNNRLAVIYLPPQAVTKEMLVNISDILGRVLDHPKEPGYVFTELRFPAPGTREGLVAGIPAGKRAIRISADQVEGLYGLNTGDRFDLVATMPISAGRTGGSDVQLRRAVQPGGRASGAALELEQAGDRASHRAERRHRGADGHARRADLIRRR